MSAHVVPLRVYFTIFFALMVLTALTVWIAYQDLGTMNTVVAMTIACGKATLVILYFMHVRYGDRLTPVLIAAGVIWMLVLIALTMSDYISRSWLTAPTPF